MIELVIAILSFLIGVAALAFALLSFFRVNALRKDLDGWIVDIKVRMGKLIKDINSVNELEYNVDVDQQNRINELSSKK